MSSHLACLRHCGLVADRRDGRNVYYTIPDCRVARFLPIVLAMVADNATHIATCHRIDTDKPYLFDVPTLVFCVSSSSSSYP